MPTITQVTAKVDGYSNRATVVQWTPLANGDSGDSFTMPSHSDRSVQVAGTFGTGGHCLIEGSNNGTNYVTLTDPQGNALDITSAKIEAISELTRYIRPRVSAGDGTTAMRVTLLVRRR